MKYHFPLPSHLPPCRPHALQEFLCFGHSLPSWVKSQLGDAAAPPGGMMGFAVRVPLHFVYGKASRSCRRSLTLLALSGAVPYQYCTYQLLLCPSEAVLLGTHLCPSPAAEEGQPSPWMSQLSEA